MVARVARRIRRAWLWLSQAPQSVVMRESAWAFPVALINHLVGLVLLVGMRLPLDLRLMGWAFGGVPVSQLANRTAPFALVGGIVTVVRAWRSMPRARAVTSNPVFIFKWRRWPRRWPTPGSSTRCWSGMSRVGHSATSAGRRPGSGYASVMWTPLIVAGRLTSPAS